MRHENVEGLQSEWSYFNCPLPAEFWRCFMMCDKCGAKSADVELYCKSCGSDLQIFGAGAEKVRLSSESSEKNESGTTAPVSLPSESPLGPPPPSGAFPPLPGAGLLPQGPSPSAPPASFGNLPGFPLSSPPPSGQTPPLSAPVDSSTDASDVPSFLSRKAAPSEGKPIAPAEAQGAEPVDFSFLGKQPEKKPETQKDEEEKPSEPPPPPLSPGAFSPDFFKPKEDK